MCVSFGTADTTTIRTLIIICSAKLQKRLLINIASVIYITPFHVFCFYFRCRPHEGDPTRSEAPRPTCSAQAVVPPRPADQASAWIAIPTDLIPTLGSHL